MAFNGDEGKMIDPATAQKWIDNYQRSAGPNAINAEFFGFRRIEELLGQGGAIGVRVYYAKDDAGVQRIIVVAANSNETNIGPIGGTKLDGMLLENGTLCPPYCSKE